MTRNASIDFVLTALAMMISKLVQILICIGIDSTQSVQNAITSVLSDNGFKLHTAQASRALETAKTLLQYTKLEPRQATMKCFSDWLISSLQKCCTPRYRGQTVPMVIPEEGQHGVILESSQRAVVEKEMPAHKLRGRKLPQHQKEEKLRRRENLKLTDVITK